MPYIENLEEIKSNLDPEMVLDFIQPGKTKKRYGQELRTACPVHNGDGPENFSINLTSHQWHCHSKGCKGTNLIDLVKQRENISLNEAAEKLAARFSIPIQYRENGEKRSYTSHDVLKCWNEAKPQGKDTYFHNKALIPPPIARFGNNPNGYHSTLISYRNIDGELKYILGISDRKRIYKACDHIEGAFALLGEIDSDGPFYIGEGIATVQTAWEASQRKIPAVSCGSWSNLLPVLSAIKSKYRDSKPIVLIDCDEGGNGLKAAKAISKQYPDAKFRKPYFEGISNPDQLVGRDLKDFNDLLSKCRIPLEDIAKQLENEFDLLSVKIDPKEETKTSPKKDHGRCEPAGEALKKIGFLERIKRRKLEYEESGEVKISGIPTNFPQLDEIIDGLQPGHLLILAGRTGMGKTFAAINFLKNIAIDQRIPAVLYSLEMSNTQIFYRLVSLCCGISSKKIKRGLINDEELEKVEAAIRLIEDSPLFVSDEPANSNLLILRNNLENSCKAGEIKVAFVDHVGLMNCGLEYRDNRANEIGKITMTFKILAKQYDIPCVLLSQLNREADNKERPKLSQLRESGSLEQDADIVMFVNRRDYHDKTDKPGQCEIIIEKNREGETGIVTFGYEKKTWAFKELAPINELIDEANNSTEITIGKL